MLRSIIKWTVRLALLYLIAFMATDNRRQRDRAEKQERRAENYRAKLDRIAKKEARDRQRLEESSRRSLKSLDEYFSHLPPIKRMHRQAELQQKWEEALAERQREEQLEEINNV